MKRDSILVSFLLLIGAHIISVGYMQTKKVAKPRCHAVRYIIPDAKFEARQSKIVLGYAKQIYDNGKIR